MKKPRFNIEENVYYEEDSNVWKVKVVYIEIHKNAVYYRIKNPALSKLVHESDLFRKTSCKGFMHTVEKLLKIL